MSEENKVKTEGVGKTTPSTKNTKPIFSKEVELLNGEKVTVHKLKAGQYYAAQKIYVQWLQKLQSLIQSKNLKTEDILGKDGKPDTTKIEKAVVGGKAGGAVDELLSQAEETSSLKKQLIAACLSVTVEDLNEAYYPEDLPLIFEAAREINNFNENLKKSVAL